MLTLLDEKFRNEILNVLKLSFLYLLTLMFKILHASFSSSINHKCMIIKSFPIILLVEGKFNKIFNVSTKSICKAFSYLNMAI